jgi:hypothetical protein
MESLPFAGLTVQAWLSIGLAIVIGGVILGLGRWRIKKGFWQELVRDIGIAFILAGVVSAIYEYSTRSIADHETAYSAFNRAMSALAQENVLGRSKRGSPSPKCYSPQRADRP